MSLIITLEKPPEEIPKVGAPSRQLCDQLALALVNEIARQVQEMNPAFIRMANAYNSGLSVIFIYMHDELKDPIIRGPKIQIPRTPEGG